MAFLEDNKIGKFVPRHLQRPPTPVVSIPKLRPKAELVPPKIGRPKKVTLTPPVYPDPITKAHANSVKDAMKAGREMLPLEPVIEDEIKVEDGQSVDLIVRGRPSVRAVIAATLSASGMSHPLLVGGSRSRDVVVWRQAAMYLAKILCKTSFPQIGELFHRDHSTVLHACQVAEDRPMVMACVEAIRANLNIQEATDANS